MSAFDGAAVAAHSLLGNLINLLVAKGVISPEDVRHLVDITISKLEASPLELEAFADARKILDGDLGQAFPPAQKR